jgi:uncharacterized protein (TIGR02679 family)
VRLARPELAPVVAELARRFSGGDVPATLALRGLSMPTRYALADLLGTDRLPGDSCRLPVLRLVALLGLASVDELRRTVEELHGPITDRRAQRLASAAAREELWAWLNTEVATLRHGDAPTSMLRWADSLRALGTRGGIAATRQRLQQAINVLRVLPADGVTLASLATDRTGDPHLLDHGRPLSGAVLDALARVAGMAKPDDAEAARSLWERFGVAPDPLSSTVLALGLPGGGDSPQAHWLAASAAAGEPVVLTLAGLRRWPVTALDASERVYVVENPSLVAEAAARGWAGRPPLICSSGRPTVAVVTLVRQLTASGATAYQHADFDPAGLAITRWLQQRANTLPWRMDAGSYLTAVRQVHDGVAPTSPVPPTPWDTQLATALEQERTAVYEEMLRESLLAAMA